MASVDSIDYELSSSDDESKVRASRVTIAKDKNATSGPEVGY